MDTQPDSTEQPHESDPAREDKIAGPARLVMWLFVVVFLGLGFFLIGDLLRGLWR